MSLPTVSVIIPVLNEEKYIIKCLDSVIAQDYPKELLEVVIADGGSTDKTREIIENYVKKYNFIKLVDNPKKTVNHGLNIAIKTAKSEYITRIDAHCEIAEDYVRQSIEILIEKDVQIVGGPLIAEGKTRTQKIIAAAYSSPFALGGGDHYKKDFEGFSNTVQWGSYKKEYIINLGLYDENLPRSEDEDLTFRVTKSGGKVYISPKIKMIYYPTNKFTNLFKKYYGYGVWKIALMKKHKRPLKLIQLIPMVFVMCLILQLILGFLFPFYLIRMGMLAYLILDFYFSFTNEKTNDIEDKLGLMLVHFIIHFAYGLGYWVGLFKFNKEKSENNEIPVVGSNSASTSGTAT